MSVKISNSAYSVLSTYAVLAGTGITGNATFTNGKYGSSPTPSYGVNIIGTRDSDNAGTAQTQLTDLITDINLISPSQNIGTGGLPTFTPGCYKSDSSITFTGSLTLDAQGNSNAQFFIIANDSITFSSEMTIDLVNGATNCNVFWLARTASITFSGVAPPIIPGIFIAGASISIADDSIIPVILSGRLYAKALISFAGTVNLDAKCTGSGPSNGTSPPCFKEDTEILTDQGYKLIQDLRKGDLIKTLKNDYKPIAMIGKRQMQHEITEERVKTQLYKCSQTEYPEITKDLVITGCHSILVDAFVSEEQKAKTIEVNGKIFVTDVKYRLPACADERASVYEIPGEYTIYHLALEHEDYYMNYGIYANGLLVETCSKRYLKELSNMDLIE